MKRPGNESIYGPWRISVPIYNVVLYVSVRDTMKEAVEALRPKFPEAIAHLNGDYDGYGCSLRSPSGDLGIALKRSSISRDALAHEIDHVIGYLFVYIDEEEPGIECRAYLCGWITKKVSALLQRNGIKIEG